MLFKLPILLVLFLTSTGIASAADAVLAKAYPDVKWVDAAGIRADLVGDGSAGIFAMGLDRKGKVVVAIRFGAKGLTQKLEFSPDALACSPVNFVPACDMSVPKLSKFRVEKKTPDDLLKMFDLASTGIFVKSGTAEIVIVPVGETDPFYFFWNAKDQRLEWLRL